jgi:hypothetical protein
MVLNGLSMNITGEATQITKQTLIEYVLPKERPLVLRSSSLCADLARENITYCHWKSNRSRSFCQWRKRLDLLVGVLTGTIFRDSYRCDLCQASVEKQMPGVQDYYGYDEEADKLIHVHAHYQLILGHDMTKNFRLPIEKPYLESAVQSELFKVPAPEFEFIVFVIRMVLKHSTWDAILGREGIE